MNDAQSSAAKGGTGDDRWETCEITQETFPPSYGFRVFRFRAIAKGPEGDRLAAPIKDVYGGGDERLRTGIGELTDTLMQDGWEPTGLRPGGPWWALTFRRAVSRERDRGLPS